MERRYLLIIFVRNPRLGSVKTRLAKTIGNAAALQIYNILVAHTFCVTKPLDCHKVVYYSQRLTTTDLWDTSYQKKVQQGNDLGERMSHAFRAAFANNYEKVIIIGSDVYDLKKAHIQEAFQMMDTHDVVLGPALDGGYYMLGMKKMHPEIFTKKAWGTATVLAETIAALEGVNIHLTEPLNDIDTYRDIVPIKEFQQFLKHNS